MTTSKPTTPSMSSIETAPAWFAGAIASPTTSHFVDSDGVQIHYLCWNAEDTDKPGLLFAHGYRGHARWWDFIAPFFTERFRVVALDFSGMGESGHRPRYDDVLFTRELAAVIEDARLVPATVVGHSYGGTRVFRACADFPHLIRHGIVLDSYVNFADTDTRPQPRQIGSPLPYPDYATARARYRLLPEQPAERWLRDHVAHHSLKQVEGGWRWKFDPKLPFAIFEMDGAALLSRIDVPLDYVCGQYSSVVSAERAHRIVRCLSAGRGPVIMPEAHHHLMLDQPLSLVSTLRALLA